MGKQKVTGYDDTCVDHVVEPKFQGTYQQGWACRSNVYQQDEQSHHEYEYLRWIIENYNCSLQDKIIQQSICIGS